MRILSGIEIMKRKFMTRQQAFIVIGVTNNTSKEEIRTIYLQKIKKYHPDNQVDL